MQKGKQIGDIVYIYFKPNQTQQLKAEVEMKLTNFVHGIILTSGND